MSIRSVNRPDSAPTLVASVRSICRPVVNPAVGFGLAVALALTIGGCGSSSDQSIGTDGEPSRLGFELATEEGSVTTTTARTDVTTETTLVSDQVAADDVSYQWPHGAELDEILARQIATTNEASEESAGGLIIETSGGASSGVTTTTTGSGRSPVTTVAGGAPRDPAGIYIGVVGHLGLSDPVLAPAVANPPVAAPNTHPLTGLAGTPNGRAAMVVKIDNSSRARPQAGLNAADIVVEEEVEGGITRLAAIFHSTSSIVGPVRSGRTTDIGLLGSLGKPVLAYSGANEVTDSLLRRQAHVQNHSASRSSGYWRQSGRRAPSNLFTDTAPHWASATGGAPPAWFAYRTAGESSGGTPIKNLSVSFRGNSVKWTWDGSSWLRSQGGSAHTESSGARASATNVVVVQTERVDTGMKDSVGSIVPEFVWVGSGRASVFTNGRRIDGTWTRPTLGSVATFTTSDGVVIKLTPGRTWVELIGTDVSYSSS